MKKRKFNQKGGASIEVALMMPLIAFLFMGAMDFGYYTFALITVEDAARVAALYTSTNALTAADSVTACSYVINELKTLPNVGNTVTNCAGSPLVVTATLVTGAKATTASLVSVTYTSEYMFALPGQLSNQFTWTRSVKMPCRN